MALEYFASLLFAVLIGRLIYGLVKRRQEVSELGAIGDVSEANVQPPPPDVSMATRLRAGFQRVFRSRKLKSYEYHSQFAQHDWDIDVIFYCPRQPVNLNFLFRAQKQPVVTDVKVKMGEAYKSIPFTRDLTREDGLFAARLTLYNFEPVGKVRVCIEDDVGEFEFQGTVKVVKAAYDDYPLLKEGIEAMLRDEVWEARNCLRAYERYTKTNPHVHMLLAQHHFGQKEWQETEQRALLAAAYGATGEGRQIYAGTREQQGFPCDEEQLKELDSLGDEWGLDPQLGIMVLLETEHYLCGLGHFHRRRRHTVFKVRREAAARFLRRVSFEFTPENELVLCSRMRVIRADGTIVNVGMENLTNADSESRNIFITVQQEKLGVWLLPDLKSGDIVEWTCDILSRDRAIHGKPQPFASVMLFNTVYPTLQARVTVVTPREQPLSFEQSHPSLTRSSESELSGDQIEYVFEGARYVPFRNLGFEYGDQLVNPRIAFTARDSDWSEVAASVKNDMLGKEQNDDRLPKLLTETAANGDSTLARLELMFYWIRDKLKYGVFDAAHAKIGASDRAEAILKSGFADCKDRSYLLHLACRELGVESEFYLSSTSRGIVIEDLPADQFDHVAVRIRSDDGWRYLDPTNSLCPFGSVPFPQQGMKALVLGDGGENIITLPEDAPQFNLLVIREVLDDVHDGWLSGSFFIRTRGHTARAFEENWKVSSLSHDERLVAAQQTIGHFLPGIVMASFDQLASTSESDSFTVAGKCRRAMYSTLNDQVVASIEWNLPMLPTHQWRALDFGSVFVFNYPLWVEIEVQLSDHLARNLRAQSSIEPFHAPSLGITEERATEGGGQVLHRTVAIERKMLRGGEYREHLPAFFDCLERSLQVTFSFDETIATDRGD